ncbi:UPF0758 domain-containing protein [Mucilaginibacter calamicampi]|uniref:UPF0758 domain-containing protein n=1 Tax=Mucilaginibacter calamicampi TaxID=1302352 RepID=A0ABW2YS74_9SPHI
MENIKILPQMERPREKLQFRGAQALSDHELLAILLGSGTPQVPLHRICDNLMKQYSLKRIAGLDLEALCACKGIGPAKATILLAAAEFSRRLQTSSPGLSDEQACYVYLKPLLAQATQLQYILLLISARREVLAFSEAGSVLPDITWVTGLAIQSGARYFILARNGWPAFSNSEAKFLKELRVAALSLNLVCDGLMTIGPESFKVI